MRKYRSFRSLNRQKLKVEIAEDYPVFQREHRSKGMKKLIERFKSAFLEKYSMRRRKMEFDVSEFDLELTDGRKILRIEFNESYSVLYLNLRVYELGYPSTVIPEVNLLNADFFVLRNLGVKFFKEATQTQRDLMLI